MLDVMAGLSVGKPHWLPRPAMRYAAAARRPPERLRIKVAIEAPIATPVHPLWRAATEAAAQLLADAGHEVEFQAMNTGTLDEFIALYQNQLAGVPAARLELLQPATRWLVEHGRKVSAAMARKIFLELSHRVHAWVGDADLVLTPTVFGPPPQVGAWSALSGEAAFRAAAEYGAFTAAFNLSGQPQRPTGGQRARGALSRGFSDRRGARGSRRWLEPRDAARAPGVMWDMVRRGSMIRL